jgi:protein-tyrosine phosphatase
MSASKIIPFLWVGSKPKEKVPLSKTVSVLVLCAAEYQPKASAFPDVRVARCPLPDDKLSLAELAQVRKTAVSVAALVRKRVPVLVTCHLGLNRSALVAGVAMCELGYSAEAAIREIKRVRGRDALYNPWFQRYIKSLARNLTLGPEDIRQYDEQPYASYA